MGFGRRPLIATELRLDLLAALFLDRRQIFRPALQIDGGDDGFLADLPDRNLVVSCKLVKFRAADRQQPVTLTDPYKATGPSVFTLIGRESPGDLARTIASERDNLVRAAATK